MTERPYEPEYRGYHRVKWVSMTDGAKMPEKGTDFSAGFDLYSVDNVRMSPGQVCLIPLGFGTEMPPEIHCRIESRSGMACKGLVVLTGVIDADYRGEWKVILMNTTREVVRIAAGTRVAQAVFRETLKVLIEPSEELTQTARGAGGFGHTGT